LIDGKSPKDALCFVERSAYVHRKVTGFKKLGNSSER
jgi:hypothetical protein